MPQSRAQNLTSASTDIGLFQKSETNMEPSKVSLLDSSNNKLQLCIKALDRPLDNCDEHLLQYLSVHYRKYIANQSV